MRERDLGRKLIVATPSLPLLYASIFGGLVGRINAASSCQFVLGFKALHDAAPGIVGDCLDNEAHNPVNGDGLEHTTKGLAVWRKASNSMAFTNGAQTFLLDPSGKIISRDALARFNFEPDYLASIVSIDPAFPPDKAIRIRNALYTLPYESIDINYLDLDFKAAAGKWPPGLLEQVMGYVGSKKPVEFLQVVDNISPNLPPNPNNNACPPETSLTCWFVNDTLSKSGSVILYPSVFTWPDEVLTSTQLKEILAIAIVLYMKDSLKITDIGLIRDASEQISLDIFLNYIQRILPADSLTLKQFVLSEAPRTLGQSKLISKFS